MEVLLKVSRLPRKIQRRQTRRGFLSGGSARQTASLNDVEKDIQLEEAYARATVALTRARRLCVLLCPLDQKGPIGAATILGCLQYGLGYLQHSHLEMPLWRESRMLTAPSDATFMSRLHATTPTSMLPPLSILAMRPSPSRSGYEFMRLHLVVVDVNYHYGPFSNMPHRIAHQWPATGTRALSPFAMNGLRLDTRETTVRIPSSCWVPKVPRLPRKSSLRC